MARSAPARRLVGVRLLGQSADGVLQAALEFRPHVLFMHLPLGEGPSGLDLTRQLRQRPELRHVLIAAVTGWARVQDKFDAHAAGIDCFFVKPFDIDELVEVVRSLDCDKLVA